MRLVDLSLPLDDGPSERVPVRIRYVDHREGAVEMSAVFGVRPSIFPDGLGWAGEELTLITHAGTHMDAPWHYGPLSEGRRARYIGEVPLEWCLAPGVVLDVRDVADGAEITTADLERAVARTGRSLAPGDIVLLRTGADAHWGQPDYPDRGAGLGRKGLLWLLAHGIRVIGIDAWGLDRSFPAMRADYERTRDPAKLWPAHFAGREREYCQLEKLANLHLLPSVGFTVICFPVKVARAGAAWTRVVAQVPEWEEGGRP
jgi:kynurenine formamidase